MKVSGIVAALLLAGGSQAFAQPLFPSPSVPSVAEEKGWAFGIGLSAEYEAEYDGSDEYGVDAEPGFAIQYRRGAHMAFLEGAELGWRARLGQQWLLQAGLRLEGGREEDEAPELAGLGDTEVEVGVGFLWVFWRLPMATALAVLSGAVTLREVSPRCAAEHHAPHSAASEAGAVRRCS